MKARWNGLCVAVLYVILRMAVKWGSPSGYGDYKTAIGMLAVSLCIYCWIKWEQGYLIPWIGAGKGVSASENTFVMAIKVSTVGVLSLQYLAIALLLSLLSILCGVKLF